MKNLTPMDRQQLIEDIQFKSASGEESLGKSIRRLRLEITGLDQDSFARMCKLTTKTLSTLENDRGNPTINTLNGILKPFGLAMTLGALRHQPTTPIRQNEEEPARKRGASPKRQKAALQTAPFQPVAE